MDLIGSSWLVCIRSQQWDWGKKKLFPHVQVPTTVGLEAQATAFYRKTDGVIKYLALFPQVNKPETVFAKEYEGEDTPCEYHAFQKCETLYGNAEKDDTSLEDMYSTTNFSHGCWIHTHPRWKAFMSPLDIFQMYQNQLMQDCLFGKVLSPRQQGVKALCVRISREGFEELEGLRMGYRGDSRQQFPSIREYMVSQFQKSNTKFYYQIPFTLSPEPCTLVDFRRSEEISEPIKDFLAHGHADWDWI